MSLINKLYFWQSKAFKILKYIFEIKLILPLLTSVINYGQNKTIPRPKQTQKHISLALEIPALLEGVEFSGEIRETRRPKGGGKATTVIPILNLKCILVN